MSEQSVKAPKPAKRRWRSIVLPVSLALNLLFVGAMVGAGWMRHKQGQGFGGPSNFALNRLLHHLPDAKRQSILDQIKGHRRAHNAKRHGLRAHHEGLKKAMGSDPFNAEQVHQMAKNLHIARGALVNDKMELLVNVLAQLTPDERRKVLESHFFRRLFNRDGRRGFRRDMHN